MYSLKLTFNDNTNINCDISMSGFNVTEIYYSDSLTQSDNSVKLQVPYTTQLASKLLETADSNTTQAFLTDDSSPIFTGYVRKTFGLSKKQRPKFISIELVSPSFLLKIKTTEDIALTNDPTIADCVNALLSAAGFDDRVTGPTDTISVFYVASGTKYSETLDSLLLSYSYTWDFDESGNFAIYPIFNQPESAITQNFDGTNIQGTLKIDHKALEYDGVQVNWKNVKEIENAIIFEDTTNQADGYDCQIEIASDDYLGDNGEDGYYAQYDSDEGDILYISSAHLDTKYDSDGIIESLTNYSAQGLVKIHNTSSKSINITQMHIIGSGYVDCGTCESKTTDGNNLNPIDANFCYIKETAALLAQNYSNWQKYSTITIDLTSYQDFKKGSFCTVLDNWVGRFIGRITQKEWNEPKSDTLYSYHIEAIASYDPSSIKTSVKKNSSSSSPVVSIEHSVSDTEIVKENIYGTVDNKIVTYNGLKVKINSKNEGENTFINIGNKSTLISKPVAKSVGALTIKPADYVVTYGAKTIDGSRNLIIGDWYVYIGTDESGNDVTIPYRWNGNEFTELSSDNSNWATVIDNAKSVALSSGRPITTSSSLLYAYIKMLAVSDAMIDNLVATTAFINKLTASSAFITNLYSSNALIDNLVTKKLKIGDEDYPNIGLHFNILNDNGSGVPEIKATYNGETLWSIDSTTGKMYGNFSQVKQYLAFDFGDSLDSTHPLVCDFYIPENATIDKVKIIIKGQKYRGYSKSLTFKGTTAATGYTTSLSSWMNQPRISNNSTTQRIETGESGDHSHSYTHAGGYGSNHTSTDGSHSHSVHTSYYDDNISIDSAGAHSHTFSVSMTNGSTGSSGSHTHYINAPINTASLVGDFSHSHIVDISHSHDIVFGIFEGEEPTNMTVAINNNTSESISPEEKKEITVTETGWNTATITSTTMGRVAVHIIAEVRIDTTQDF